MQVPQAPMRTTGRSPSATPRAGTAWVLGNGIAMIGHAPLSAPPDSRVQSIMQPQNLPRSMSVENKLVTGQQQSLSRSTSLENYSSTVGRGLQCEGSPAPVLQESGSGSLGRFLQAPRVLTQGSALSAQFSDFQLEWFAEMLVAAAKASDFKQLDHTASAFMRTLSIVRVRDEQQLKALERCQLDREVCEKTLREAKDSEAHLLKNLEEKNGLLEELRSSFKDLERQKTSLNAVKLEDTLLMEFNKLRSKNFDLQEELTNCKSELHRYKILLTEKGLADTGAAPSEPTSEAIPLSSSEAVVDMGGAPSGATFEARMPSNDTLLPSTTTLCSPSVPQLPEEGRYPVVSAPTADYLRDPAGNEEGSVDDRQGIGESCQGIRENFDEITARCRELVDTLPQVNNPYSLSAVVRALEVPEDGMGSVEVRGGISGLQDANSTWEPLPCPKEQPAVDDRGGAPSESVFVSKLPAHDDVPVLASICTMDLSGVDEAGKPFSSSGVSPLIGANGEILSPEDQSRPRIDSLSSAYLSSAENGSPRSAVATEPQLVLVRTPVMEGVKVEPPAEPASLPPLAENGLEDKEALRSQSTPSFSHDNGHKLQVMGHSGLTTNGSASNILETTAGISLVESSILSYSERESSILTSLVASEAQRIEEAPPSQRRLRSARVEVLATSQLPTQVETDSVIVQRAESARLSADQAMRKRMRPCQGPFPLQPPHQLQVHLPTRMQSSSLQAPGPFAATPMPGAASAHYAPSISTPVPKDSLSGGNSPRVSPKTSPRPAAFQQPLVTPNGPPLTPQRQLSLGSLPQRHASPPAASHPSFSISPNMQTHNPKAPSFMQGAPGSGHALCRSLSPPHLNSARWPHNMSPGMPRGMPEVMEQSPFSSSIAKSLQPSVLFPGNNNLQAQQPAMSSPPPGTLPAKLPGERQSSPLARAPTFGECKDDGLRRLLSGPGSVGGPLLLETSGGSFNEYAGSFKLPPGQGLESFRMDSFVTPD